MTSATNHRLALLEIMGGYALAKFRFPGRKAVFAVIIGSISVPGTALAVPQIRLFALYLMWIFSEQAVPTELLEAARVDGAGEFRTFFQVSLPLPAPSKNPTRRHDRPQGARANGPRPLCTVCP